MAVAAVSLASCGGRTLSTAEPDSLCCEQDTCIEKCAKGQANEVVALLGDTESAETYTALISNFIADNATKLQEIGASETIQSALSQVEGLPDDIIATATEAVTGVKSAALTSALSAIAKGESVMDAVKAAAEEVVAKGTEVADDAKAAAEAAPDAVKEAAKKQANDAVNKAIDDAAAAAKKELGL